MRSRAELLKGQFSSGSESDIIFEPHVNGMCSRGGGGQLPLKGRHHARLKKHVKRVVFFQGRAMYERTVERVSKLPKFGKKGILFNSFDTRLGYIFY